MIIPDQNQTILNFIAPRFFSEIDILNQVNILKLNIARNIQSISQNTVGLEPIEMMLNYIKYGRHHTETETKQLFDLEVIGYSQPKLISYLASSRLSSSDSANQSTLNYVESELSLTNTKTASHDIWCGAFPFNYTQSISTMTNDTLARMLNSPFISELKPDNRLLTSSIYIYETLHNVLSIVMGSSQTWEYTVTTTPLTVKQLPFKRYYLLSSAKSLQSGIISGAIIRSDIDNLLNFNDLLYTKITDIVVNNIAGKEHATVDFYNNVKNTINNSVKTLAFSQYVENRIDALMINIGRDYSDFVFSNILSKLYGTVANPYYTPLQETVGVGLAAHQIPSLISEQSIITSITNELSDIRAEQLLFLEHIVTENANNRIELLNNYVHAYSQLSIDFNIHSIGSYIQSIVYPSGIIHQSSTNIADSKPFIAQDIVDFVNNYDFSMANADNVLLLESAVSKAFTSMFSDFIAIESKKQSFIDNIILPIETSISETEVQFKDVVSKSNLVESAIILAFNDVIYNSLNNALPTVMPNMRSVYDYTGAINANYNSALSALNNTESAFDPYTSKIPNVISASIISVLMNSMLDQFSI